MKLSEIKTALRSANEVNFRLPDGNLVPSHFHVTEVGMVSKHFIDCGGTVRKEEVAALQLWEANDYDHRLHPEKLINIIELSQRVLQLPDLETEVEYQADTIGRYDLSFVDGEFRLLPKKTACLASDQCGVPPQKQKVRLSELTPSASSSCCTPGSGCC